MSSLWRVLGPTVLLITCISCTPPQPIHIGFVGGLTGRVADLGIAGRDGVLLAVEQRNRQGGIGGRPIQAFIADDRNDPETARRVDEDLINRGVVAIIGHMTSSMSMVGASVADNRGRVMLSPTTATNSLTGIDDHFLRICPASAVTTRLLARRVAVEMNLKRAFVIYDLSNRDHTESAFREFDDELRALGGEVVGVQTFISGPAVVFSEISRQALASGADCLFILANAMDTAMICQQLTKAGSEVQVVATSWSATDELIQFGGRAVNGLFTLQTVDRESHSPDFLAFREEFKDRFDREPGFASVLSYDCAQLLFAALEITTEPSQLRDSILDLAPFQGLQSEINLDRFGDATREHFPVRVRDGRLATGG